MARHNSDPLICRRVISSTRASHYLSASSHHRSASIAMLDKSKSFASAMSLVWLMSESSPSRRATFLTSSLASPRAEASEVALSWAPSHPGWPGPLLLDRNCCSLSRHMASWAEATIARSTTA
jgi:hypothetical protein